MKKLLTGFIAGLLLVGLTGCGRTTLYSQNKFFLGSIFEIAFYERSNNEGKRKAERVFNDIYDTLQQLDTKLNPLSPISELSSINSNASFSSVQVSALFFNLLSKSVKATELTEGAFDITFAPLVELVAMSGGTINQTKIKELLRRTGPTAIKLDSTFNKVDFAMDGVRVNMSRIQRGYAIDQIIQLFKQHRIRKGYVKAGRSLYVLGSKRNWVAEIPDPLNEGKTLKKIGVKNKAVSYASVQENYFKDVAIWAPRVNVDYPPTPPIEVVVIAPNALTAEVLSDAVMVLGQSKGMSLIDKLSYDVLIVARDEKGNYKYVGDRRLFPKR